MNALKKLLMTIIALAIVLPAARYFGRRAGEEAARRKTTSAGSERIGDSNPNAAANPATQGFVWQPKGSEYSVTFPATPKISESLSTVGGTQVAIQVAEYMEDKGWEQANLAPYTRSAPTTKDEAYANMTNYAKAFGMEHFDIHFDDSNPDDIVATIKGTKTVKTQYGDVLMSFLGQAHWGRQSVFSIVISAPAKDHPTKEGLAFVESLKQHL